MSNELKQLRKRLISLDVFRGIAITGMILVNMAGVADRAFPALVHADWNGCTLADLVFPFFLFIVGVAIAFSLAKYTDGNKPTPAVYWRIIRRSLILFALGLLLNGFWNYDWSSIRIMGVLQRISLTYLLAALIILNVPRKGQWAIAALLLMGYWLAMSLVPVPGYGIGNLTREGNLGAYIDRLIIGTAHLYKGDNFNSLGDPEGLFSTIPAIVSVLFGYFTGDWLRKQRIESYTSMSLVLFGLSCLVVGEVWGFWLPINKKLWTSSFVVFTAGWALLLLAACYELIEVRDRRHWGKPFEIMGLNAIFVFITSVLAIKILVKTHIGTGENAPAAYNWIYDHLFVSWAGAMNGSLLFALVTVLFWWVVLYGMYKKRWFVKV
ncbi:MAG TPA: heparan-alpha-glucosaminide N-acetyltransferase domain-containing protein [Allocoleopsis sp.]